MQFTLTHIGPKSRAGALSGYEPLIQMYLERTSAWHRASNESFRTEADFLEWIQKQRGRQPAIPVLFDSRGKSLTSEKFAEWLGQRRDEGAQHIVFAIGGADGWSKQALVQAQLALNFGSMTLAHDLARLVAAEQIYRATTILANHPYHTGH